MRTLLKSAGFTLIEVMMATGIISLCALSAFSIISSVDKVKRNNDSLESLTKYRANLIHLLRSPDAFALMGDPAHNNVPCFKTMQSCAATSTPYAALSVVDRDGSRLTDKNSPSAGFGYNAEPCPDFPSKKCPFRYETEWRSLCSSPVTCKSPQFKARGVLKMAPDLPIALNPEHYGFEITLGQMIGSYEQGCTSVGGVYVPGDPPRCTLASATDCPPGQAITGVNKALGQITCAPIFRRFSQLPTPTAPGCPSGTRMIGTDANMMPVCDIVKIVDTTLPGCAPGSTDLACQPVYNCQVDPTLPECRTMETVGDGLIFTPTPGGIPPVGGIPPGGLPPGDGSVVTDGGGGGDGCGGGDGGDGGGGC